MSGKQRIFYLPEGKPDLDKANNLLVVKNLHASFWLKAYSEAFIIELDFPLTVVAQ